MRATLRYGPVALYYLFNVLGLIVPPLGLSIHHLHRLIVILCATDSLETKELSIGVVIYQRFVNENHQLSGQYCDLCF